MTSVEFIEELRDLLEIGDRQIAFDNHNRLSERYDTVYVDYINLPHGVGGAGGGAERENNRMMFVVRGFGRGLHESTNKVKIETSISNLHKPGVDRSNWREARWTLRAKTGTPEVVAKYLASFLNKTAAEIEPNFTHTRM